ncbi:MAG: type II secretion system GspH family protein [Muribaculaceae bacterium]|nr:type II secretion system GspH family protein [Muribaculaceae bacterium]
MKSGFTLAEVLITLGIIGVVAAMTIPNLINNHQKKETVTRLQKAISVINQAYRQSFDDLGEPERAFELGAEEYFKTYWAPYLKVSRYCDTYKVCGYVGSHPYRLHNRKVADVYLPVSGDVTRILFELPDGVTVMVITASENNNKFTADYRILIDLNGNKNPNIFGKDVFMLNRYTNGLGVQPMGYQKSDSAVNSDCENVSWSNSCAEKIRRAGWQIDKSYPWK